MDALTQLIAERLSEKPSCTVFESSLGRVFPVNKREIEKRRAAIKAFAAERGWEATIADPGIRVTFRKIKDQGPK
jgi:hypothetical protein